MSPTEMSDRRLQWSHSEKELLLQLRHNYPGSTISETKYLFNEEVPFERHRTDEAIKSQLSRLKGKGPEVPYSEAQLYQQQSLPQASSTKDVGTTSSSHSGKFAFAAPEFGIYVPLHPLHDGDPFFVNYAKYLIDMPDPSKTNFRRD